MAIVIDRSQRWRVIAAHMFLIALCAAVIFPLLMVISISLRPGNFATGRLLLTSVIPEEKNTAYGALYYAWAGLTAGIAPFLAGAACPC